MVCCGVRECQRRLIGLDSRCPAPHGAAPRRPSTEADSHEDVTAKSANTARHKYKKQCNNFDDVALRSGTAASAIDTDDKRAEIRGLAQGDEIPGLSPGRSPRRAVPNHSQTPKGSKTCLRATPHRLLPDSGLSTTVEALYRTQCVEPAAHSAVPPPLTRSRATDSFRATCSPPPGRPRAPTTRPLAPASQGRTNQATPRPRAPRYRRYRPRLCQSPMEPASRHSAKRETKHPATPVTPATQVTTPARGIINSIHETISRYEPADTRPPQQVSNRGASKHQANTSTVQFSQDGTQRPG